MALRTADECLDRGGNRIVTVGIKGGGFIDGRFGCGVFPHRGGRGNVQCPDGKPRVSPGKVRLQLPAQVRFQAERFREIGQGRPVSGGGEVASSPCHIGFLKLRHSLEGFIEVLYGCPVVVPGGGSDTALVGPMRSPAAAAGNGASQHEKDKDPSFHE
jgi:hypothetical protein